MKQRKGYIHIYYGDGKGKTTAATGLVVRAAASDWRVCFCQFLKDNKSSERKILAGIPNITLYQGLTEEKFSFQMNESEKIERKTFYEKQLLQIYEEVQDEKYDLICLDEILYAIRVGLMDEDTLLGFLKRRPPYLEIILTGNYMSEELHKTGDYISEIKKVKHPYDQGTAARDGIER